MDHFPHVCVVLTEPSSLYHSGEGTFNVSQVNRVTTENPAFPRPKKEKKSLLNALSTQTTEIELVCQEHLCAPGCGGWWLTEEAHVCGPVQYSRVLPRLSAPRSAVLLSCKGAERR